MDRRTLLTSAGAGAVSLIAGCTSDSDTADQPSSPSPTPTPNPQAADALEDAESDLGEAIDLIYREVENAWSTTGDASLSTAGIEVALSNANESLDAATEDATGAQQAQIDETRDYASYVDQILSVLVSVGDGTNQVSTAISYEQSSRYEDGAEKLSEAVTIFEEASSQMSDAQTTLDEVDEAMLGDIDYAEAQESATELANIIEGYRRLMAAGVHYDKGLADYYSAAESYNDENYSQASDTFDAAAEHFIEAENEFRSGEEEVTQSLKSSFISQTCNAEVFKEASQQWALAADNAAAGNYEAARENADEASSILDRTCG